MSSQDHILYRARDYIAGSIGGITQVLIGQPFDTIKVRLQSAATRISMKECIQDLIQHEGIFAFYKGVASPLICTSAIISIQFGVFQGCMREMKEVLKVKELSITQISLCGAVSGLACSGIMSPMEHIRIKIFNSLSSLCKIMKDNLYKNTFQCVASVYKNFGLKGIYKGYLSTLYREIPGEAVYFLAYEFQMRKLRDYLQNNKTALTYAPLLAGGVSGLVFWMAVYPIDTLKSRLQADSLSAPKYKNFIDAYHQTVKQEGFNSLFKGVQVCAIRSVPVNAFGFLAFEETKLLIENHYKKQESSH